MSSMTDLLVRRLPLWLFLAFTALNVLLFNMPRELFANPLLSYSLPLLAGVAGGLLVAHGINVHAFAKPNADQRPLPWGLLVMFYGVMPTLMFAMMVPALNQPTPELTLWSLFVPFVPFGLAFFGASLWFNRYLDSHYGKPYWAARKAQAVATLNTLLLDLPYDPQVHAVILQQADKLEVHEVERLILSLRVVRRYAPAALPA
jgi:hypothetical protein